MLDRAEVHRAGRDDSLQMCFLGKAALPGGEQNSLFLKSMTFKVMGSKGF